MPYKTALNTEVRRRVQRALRTRSFRAALRSNTGAIDLASIMVGVIVIGVIAGVIAATVFAVIPWSQDSAAKNSLDAVRTAESVQYAQSAGSGTSAYTDLAGLVAGKLIQSSPSVLVGVNAAGTCYVAVSKSATGKQFYLTDSGPDVRPFTSATTTTCLNGPDLAALAGTALASPLEACRTTPNPTAANVATAAALTAAFTAGGPIQLTADISMDQVTAAANKTTTLDLNGHNLVLSATSAPAVGVPSGATFVLGNNSAAGGLTALTTSLGASAIGGSNSFPGGNVTIACGTVNATSSLYGAAIGGGSNNSFQSVTISGGVVTASSGSDTVSGSYMNYGGAAIGGGSGNYGSGTVTVSGGVVNATSGSLLAQDIGRGYDSHPPANVSVTLSGGLVQSAQFPVTSGAKFTVSAAPAITRALRATSQLPGASPSTVKMAADILGDTTGFSIVTGSKVTLDLNGHTLSSAPRTVPAFAVPVDATFVIDDSATGGVLNASAADPTGPTSGAAAIGSISGNGYGTGHIIINGGTVNAISSKYGAAIGGGSTFQSIDINGGTVNATADQDTVTYSYYNFGGAGIGGNSGNYGSGVITITGGTVHARAASPYAQNIGNGYPHAGSAVSVVQTGGTIN